jgi:hypothetical protein
MAHLGSFNLRRFESFHGIPFDIVGNRTFSLRLTNLYCPRLVSDTHN